MSFAIRDVPPRVLFAAPHRLAGALSRLGPRLAFDDRVDVVRAKDQELVSVDLELLSAVLAVDDEVADLDVERDAALAVLVPATIADSDDLALLRLLLGGVRDEQTGLGLLLGLACLDDHAVAQWLQLHYLPSIVLVVGYRCRGSAASMRRPHRVTTAIHTPRRALLAVAPVEC
jgi:hypothetical protein